MTTASACFLATLSKPIFAKLLNFNDDDLDLIIRFWSLLRLKEGAIGPASPSCVMHLEFLFHIP